jgi:hypothetical protein
MVFVRVKPWVLYSETCEIRTPLKQAKSVHNSEVSSFHRLICTENSNLGPDELSLFYRMASFRRVAIHRFHCIWNVWMLQCTWHIQGALHIMFWASTSVFFPRCWASFTSKHWFSFVYMILLQWFSFVYMILLQRSSFVYMILIQRFSFVYMILLQWLSFVYMILLQWFSFVYMILIQRFSSVYVILLQRFSFLYMILLQWFSFVYMILLQHLQSCVHGVSVCKSLWSLLYPSAYILYRMPRHVTVLTVVGLLSVPQCPHVLAALLLGR